MIRTNKDYAKRVKERLDAKYPGLYSDVPEAKIRGVIQFFTRNITRTVYMHHHASVLNFFNISPNTNQLFEYRMTLLKRKTVKELWPYLKSIKAEIKSKNKK